MTLAKRVIALTENSSTDSMIKVSDANLEKAKEVLSKSGILMFDIAKDGSEHGIWFRSSEFKVKAMELLKKANVAFSEVVASPDNKK